MNNEKKIPSFGHSSRSYQKPLVSYYDTKSKTWKVPEKNNSYYSGKQLYRDRDIRSAKAIKTLNDVERITANPERQKHVDQATLKPCKEFTKSEMGKILVKKGTTENFGNQNYIINDYWQSATTEIPAQLVGQLDDLNAEDDSLIPAKKQRLEREGEEPKSPPYTKEFHLLSEVQKTRILQVVEDVIKKLATEDHYQAPPNEEERPTSVISYRTNVERLFCKKFLLPWMTMKVVETVLCHIIQLLFLAENSYFQKKREFLPIVVTYYLTLFIIVLSLVIHIGSFSYAGIQNPCYLMGVISSSILTLTTTFGIFVMLFAMTYYKAFLQILVLLFLGILLCLIFAELLLCYVEVRNMWNKVGYFEQFYVT